MNEKELLNFIEKLVSKLPNDKIWLDDEIKNLDPSVNINLVRNKLFELELLKETDEIYDELDSKGLELKKIKTFKKLNKSNEPDFFEKHKYKFIALGAISAFLILFKGSDLKNLKLNKFHHPTDSIQQKSDTITNKIKSYTKDTLQIKI
jgi:hypothetical protein